ncbi:MAG: hypothetical protein AB7N91_06745 [Candidatus Tectimicrobiota bacterium]
MHFLRATRRTNETLVLINVDHITAIQQETSDNTLYAVIILHNGREIDVSETLEELSQRLESDTV